MKPKKITYEYHFFRTEFTFNSLLGIKLTQTKSP